MKGFPLLNRLQAALHTGLVTHHKPVVEILGCEIFPAAVFIQERQNHALFRGMRRPVIRIRCHPVCLTGAQLIHLFLEESIRDYSLAIRLEELAYFKIRM